MKFTLLFAMAAVTNAITLQKQGIADESYDTKLDGLENTVSTNHNNERSNKMLETKSKPTRMPGESARISVRVTAAEELFRTSLLYIFTYFYLRMKISTRMPGESARISVR